MLTSTLKYYYLQDFDSLFLLSLMIEGGTEHAALALFLFLSYRPMHVLGSFVQPSAIFLPSPSKRKILNTLPFLYKTLSCYSL